MNKNIANRILKRFIDNNLIIQIRISGNSMNPILFNNETVNAKKKSNYKPGDILIFRYKHNDLLAHRLLMIKNNRYYCKGDNSFRIEDIDYDQILGVVLIDDDKHNNVDFINFSLKIGDLFRKCKYKTDLLVLTEEYKKYSTLYLNSSEEN